MKWHTGPPEETVTWVLLAESALGPPLPPIAYVPQLNLKAHGGPQAFGFARLAGFGREPMDIPVARDLAAQLTAGDVDLIRPGGNPAGFVAGYRNPARPDDQRFAGWRACAGLPRQDPGHHPFSRAPPPSGHQPAGAA